MLIVRLKIAANDQMAPLPEAASADARKWKGGPVALILFSSAVNSRGAVFAGAACCSEGRGAKAPRTYGQLRKPPIPRRDATTLRLIPTYFTRVMSP